MITRRFNGACLAGLLVVFAIAGRANGVLINGDFETGDLTGWMTYTTTQGTLGASLPDVVSFDTNGNGTATDSARFQVGSTGGVGSEGGGIFQSFTALAGQLFLSVDLAAQNTSGSFNAQAGRFRLLLDGTQVGSVVDFMGISPNSTERQTLSATTTVTAGTHEFRIEITRPFGSSTTLTQYVDNASAVPEPSTTALMCTAVIAACGYRIRRRRRAQSNT